MKMVMENSAGRWACKYNGVVRNLPQRNVSGQKKTTEALFIKGQKQSYVIVQTLDH